MNHHDVANGGVSTLAAVTSDVVPSRLELLARPLLELVQRLTGVETSFLSEIDWTSQEQHIVVACNSGAMEVPAGIAVPWTKAMCRHVLLSGRPQSTDVPRDFPGSVGADLLGMQSVFAVPILDGDDTIGTVCGASRRVIELGCDQLEMVLLISDALAQQVKSDVERRADELRAAQALDLANELALTDSLTGLANRRGFDARWEQELARSGRHAQPLALLMIDIDAFKAVNDAHGHAGGDRALRALGELLQTISRAEDVAARVGGDEFALAVPHAANEAAETLANRVRELFSAATTAMGIPCTVSIGISSTEHTHRARLLTDADNALYRSKHLGGNRVEVWHIVDA